MKKVVIGIVVAVAIVLVLCLVPLKEVAYTVMVDYQDTETYYEDEQLQYRTLPYCSIGFVESRYFSEPPESPLADLENWAAAYGYQIQLSGEPVLPLDHFALCVVIQNLDDIAGIFQVRYTLATADREAAERQKNLIQRTTEEWNELGRQYYEGSLELRLGPKEIGVFICPPGGIYIAPDRTPFDHTHEIVPATIQVEEQRTVTRQREETRYRKVALLDYWLHY